MIIHAHTGEATHHLRGGKVRHFRPKGPLHYATLDGGPAKKARENVERLGSGSQAARLFVGLKVGQVDTYSIDDVIAETAKVRGAQGASKDASFLAQMGTYEDRSGALVVEDSVQIVILDFAGMSKEAFTRQMTALGEALREKFQQEAVIVELQERGVVTDVYTVSA